MNAKLKEKLLSLPTTSGVYLMKDISGTIIYVGKAKNLKRRVNSYFVGNNKNIKTLNLVDNIVDFDYIVTNSEMDALMLENNLIKKYQPHYNILLKDGKNFPYIKINTKDDFPKLEVTRKVKNDGAKYFGPYFNGISPEQILKIVGRAFSLRTCKSNITEKSKTIRPCLNYSMGLCSAPCAKKVSREQYKNQVEQVIKFLKGDTKDVENILKDKLNLASESLNFEKAIEIRDEIFALEKLKQKYTTQFSKLINQDVIGYYSTGTNAVISVLIIRDGKQMAVENFSLLNATDFKDIADVFLMQYYNQNRTIPKTIILPEQINAVSVLEEYLSQKSNGKVNIIVSQKGTNKKLCEIASQNSKEYLEKSLGTEKTKQIKTIGAINRLKEVLNLNQVPYRMECYDISNTGGTNSVASMSVFVNGEPAKKMYRKFNIKTVEGPNDFESLKEVIARRLNEFELQKDQSFSVKPNLIVIDGGKGQLSSVMEVFKNYVGKIEICSLAKQFEEIFLPNNPVSVRLAKNDVALQVLQRLRDEAHRFGITFHRQKRSKAMTKSILDDIKGIGKTKKQQLFERFGSLQNIKNASVKELCLIRGLTQQQAREILKKLNGEQ
ncbi:MAG: excinuclease ABC subunit UvrC [Christensenellales bacterium]